MISEIIGSSSVISSLKIGATFFSILNSIFLIYITSVFEGSFYEYKNYIILYFNLALFIIVFSKDFLPSYKGIVLFNINYMPLSIYQKFILWFIGNEISFINILLVINLLLLSLSPFFNFLDVISFLSYTFIGIFLSFCIRFNLTYQYNFKKTYLLFTGLLIFTFVSSLAFLIYFKATLSSHYLFSFLFLLFFLLLVVCYFKVNHLEVFGNNQLNINSEKFTIFRISSKLTISLLSGFIYKTIFLILSYLSLKYKGHYLFDSELLFFMIISPVALFTYGINNFFAFNSNYYFNFILRTDAFKYFLSDYFFVFCILFAIDIFISVPFMYFNFKDDFIQMLLSYSVFIFFLLPVGFLSSVFFPVKIHNKSIMSNIKMYTNPLVGIVEVIYLYLCFKYLYFFSFVIFFVLNAILLLFLKTGFSKAKYNFIKQVNDI